MYTIERKWVKAVNAPPCEGYYLYRCGGGGWLTYREYCQFKREVIKELWISNS